MIGKLLLGWIPKLLLGLLDRLGWRRAGVEAERRKRAEDAIRKGRQARDAARRAEDETDGLDDDAIRDRLRDRTDKFR